MSHDVARPDRMRYIATAHGEGAFDVRSRARKQERLMRNETSATLDARLALLRAHASEKYRVPRSLLDP